MVPIQKGNIEVIEKVQKKATKLVTSLKHLPCSERLKQLMLSTLKYRILRGDMRHMIEVFKIVHDFHHLEAAVKKSEMSTNYRNLHVIIT